MPNLENVLKKATDSTTVRGVYWCGRDLSSSPLGNHHFFALVYADKAEAERFKAQYSAPCLATLDYRTLKNAQEVEFYVSTLGLRRGDKNMIVIDVNDNDDHKAIWEVADDDNRSWWKPDFDLEAHLVPPLPNTSIETLMENLYDLWQDYETARHNNNIPRVVYALMDENCAAVANTFLRVLGYSWKQREALGEMWGIDWGEEDDVPMDLFSAMTTALPDGNYRDIRNIALTLHASCRTESGSAKKSTLDVTYTRIGDIENRNGALVWRRDGVAPSGSKRRFLPRGTYQDSSTDLRVVLRADCRVKGGWASSEIELADLDDIYLQNVEGVLAGAPRPSVS